MSHVYITESGTFATDAKKLAASPKFREIVKKYSRVKIMSFSGHVFNKCLICKNCNFENAYIDVYCKKQNNEPVNNYQMRKCIAKKYFSGVVK